MPGGYPWNVGGIGAMDKSCRSVLGGGLGYSEASEGWVGGWAGSVGGLFTPPIDYHPAHSIHPLYAKSSFLFVAQTWANIL